MSWTLHGLVTHYVLFFIELATHSVHIAGITPDPNDAFMVQSRNLTDVVDGFLLGKRYLIVDRDSKYSQAFRGLLERGGIESIRLRPHPELKMRLNARRLLTQRGVVENARLHLAIGGKLCPTSQMMNG